MTAWLHIVGIGEDGFDGLLPATRAVIEAAEVIIGGDRHHNLSKDVVAERIAWPSPFDALTAQLHALRGRRVVVLATGDPLWFSVGARIGRSMDPSEIVYHPQLSAFQLAAARMGWSMADVETLTVHGRPVQQMIAFIQPDQRLLILTTGAETPAQIAKFLAERGFGASRMTVLAAMGGENEARFDGIAASWNHDVPAFNTLAVECVAAPDAALLPRVPGLADDLFTHDGTMTKREVRAVTLAKLMPMRGALLWDIGTGCGSVAVEWMRSARYARAIGIEPRADRRAMAAANALALGVPKLELIDGTAPQCLTGLAAPDAIFVGGGLTSDVFQVAWDALKPLGRLVANAVTLESEMHLIGLQQEFGGELVKLSINRAEPVGPYRGWKPFDAGHPMELGQKMSQLDASGGSILEQKKQGRLFGVGLGPGDPELITLKAARLIGQAAVVAYPALEGGASFARSIAAELIPADCREIVINVPMRTERAPAQAAYDLGALAIAAELEAGRDVVVLCEGDPFFYGSFMYLFARLSAQFETLVVPGVTSVTAAAAGAGLPLVARNERLTVLPGPLPEAELRARIDGAESVVIMKLGRHLPKLRAILAELGLADQATYVERVGLGEERICALADAPETAPYFSMILLVKGGDPWL